MSTSTRLLALSTAGVGAAAAGSGVAFSAELPTQRRGGARMSLARMHLDAGVAAGIGGPPNQRLAAAIAGGLGKKKMCGALA